MIQNGLACKDSAFILEQIDQKEIFPGIDSDLAAFDGNKHCVLVEGNGAAP